MLHKLDPSLVAVWEGAGQALRSENPEMARHVGSSLRELFTHVLHGLSPNEQVKAWSTDPTHYHKGQPTRKARLLFACRLISSPQLDVFIEKDVAATLAFLDLFQTATHSIPPTIRDRQIAALIVKLGGLLRYLLAVGTSFG